MGGCCCCSSRQAESDGPPIYYYVFIIEPEREQENTSLVNNHRCPQNLEEHEPLSASHGTSSAISAGMLVDTNLDTSIPDTYRAPPAPLPYDTNLACSQTLPRNCENCTEKTDQTQPRDSQPVGEMIVSDGFENSDTCGDLKESECKEKPDIEDNSIKAQKDESSKLDGPITSVMDEEDVCPICLEEYNLENPRLITKCEHHFHLSCILEWMERSDTCPVCDKIMMFDHGLIE